MPADSARIADLQAELEETYRSITQLTNEIYQANELLRRKNEKLGRLYATAHQFVDNVSHEFRTPLAVIKDFSSILAEGLAGEVNEEQQQYLNIVLNRTEDLAHMVDDMLDIGKLEAGLLGMVRQPCRFEAVVDPLRAVLERKAAATNATFKTAIDPDLPPIYCDMEKIGRVITNLATNAFKFSGDDGNVVLWARCDADRSQVTVGITDNGPGIAPENLTAIFERFKQVGGDVRASTKGFGLGLNIVSELVQLNFGNITVDSELGSGSTFSFTIPLFDPPRILERFMSRIEQFRNGSSYVSLITAQVVAGTNDALLEEVERFLYHQMRRTDLVFKAFPGAWLLCAATNQQQLGQMLDRLCAAHEDSNRGRAGDPLPTIDFEIAGTWRVRDQGAEFVRQFELAFAARPPRYRDVI